MNIFFHSNFLKRFDLVDMTRQFLANQATVIYKRAMKSFQEKKFSEFQEHSKFFLDLLEDMEKILKTS